jgi:tRNA dimethylallyltransferase
MFSAGLVEETKNLMEQGLTSNDPNLSAIGYREVSEYIHGNCSLEDARAAMRKKTREFVRRQRNWFKPDDQAIHWYEMSEHTSIDILNDLRIGNK